VIPETLLTFGLWAAYVCVAAAAVLLTLLAWREWRRCSLW